MTREDAIRLAMDAFLLDRHDCSDDYFIRGDADIDEIVAFASLVLLQVESDRFQERLAEHELLSGALVEFKKKIAASLK